jgi:hypothetical protein
LEDQVINDYACKTSTAVSSLPMLPLEDKQQQGSKINQVLEVADLFFIDQCFQFLNIYYGYMNGN